jgi:hypothetical protein
VKEGLRNGIKSYWFSLDINAFNDNMNDSNSNCYCEKKCMKYGLGNITPCYYSKFIHDALRPCAKSKYKRKNLMYLGQFNYRKFIFLNELTFSVQK